MRALLFILTLLVAACSSVPKAPKIPNEPGYLSNKQTRQLLEHWAGNNYPDTVAGHPIRFIDKHAGVPDIAAISPADDFSQDDKSKRHLGTVAMVQKKKNEDLRKITKHAWQLTSQPATIVAHNDSDGGLTLTALDFRSQPKFHGVPLANNHSLAFDYIEKKEDNFMARVFTLVDPAGWSERRGFYLATEYDPEKIPLIFVHGLLSTPLDFEELASEITSHPDLWERYQLWYYFYPTGDPWVITAAHFREDFRTLVNTLDPRQKTTFLCARKPPSSPTRWEDSSPNYPSRKTPKFSTTNTSIVPLEDIRLAPYQKKRLREQLLFKPLTEPAKIIFLATPHPRLQASRGSALLVGPNPRPCPPPHIIGTTFSTAQLIAFAEPGLLTQNGSTLIAGKEFSITGLRADNPALQALAKMPVRKGVELDNIVATLTGTDRGLGDWVVPYGSARMDEAKSQTIVRSGHWLIRDPETAEAVIKHLRE